jgi:hypothetical protein
LADSALIIPLQHIESTLPFFHGKNIFEYNGKKCHWKGHTALIEDETRILLGAFHSRFFEGKSHQLGRLVITEDGKQMMDMVVITCLLVQERSDEGKFAVCQF